MRSVLTIGDCIIDEIHSETGKAERFAGGAGLNLAVGIATFGLPSVFLARVGQDEDGYYLLNYARRRGIKVLTTPTVDPTGVAIATRRNGEPSYAFSPSMYRRRFHFDRSARTAITDAAIIAVNSFPLDNARQTDELVRALSANSGIVITDPNPRPSLIHDINAYRMGFEKLARMSSIIKISDEDVQILYHAGWQEITPRLFDFGVQTVLVSHGAGGARIVEKSGLSVHVPATDMDGPVIDAIGAGDATLASIIASLMRDGRPDSAEKWRACLSQAMAVAAATCRNAGAELVLP